MATEPHLRLVQHLRLTFAAPPDDGSSDIIARAALARVRFIGSSWARRADTPILGLAGAVGQPHGEVSVSVVSTENRTDRGGWVRAAPTIIGRHFTLRPYVAASGSMSSLAR